MMSTIDAEDNLAEILAEAYNSGWLDCREGGDYYAKHSPGNIQDLRARIQAYINKVVIEEAEWWSYESQTLFDELWDDKYNSAKVIRNVMDDRIATLKAETKEVK